MLKENRFHKKHLKYQMAIFLWKMGKTWQYLSLHFFLTFDWLLFQWGIEIAIALGPICPIAKKLSTSSHSPLYSELSLTFFFLICLIYLVPTGLNLKILFRAFGFKGLSWWPWNLDIYFVAIKYMRTKELRSPWININSFCSSAHLQWSISLRILSYL